jgi:hypothetical protein
MRGLHLSTVTLPIYTELTHAQQDYAVDQLGAFYRRGR